PPLPQVVTAIDKNGDGILDAEEIANASAALKSLDRNGDGKLTFEEFGPPRPPNGRGRGADNNREPGQDARGQHGGGGGDQGGPGGRGTSGRGGAGPDNGRRPPPLIIRALDADGDGIISAEEIANASAALRKLDKNGDGKLTIDEYMGPPPGGRRGRGSAGV